jgi:hypothetical protein
MSFTVVWRPLVEQDLATLWMNAPDRNAVAAAADAIDATLRRDPLGQGESRGGSTRILIAPPLAVYYDVSEADRRVSVWAVWRWGQQP